MDDDEREWRCYLKRWVSDKQDQGGGSNPIYVLENIAACLKRLESLPGDLLTLWLDDEKRLRIKVEGKEGHAHRGDGRTSMMRRKMLSAQIKAMGKCSRRASCTKPDGHSGFCNGTYRVR